MGGIVVNDSSPWRDVSLGGRWVKLFDGWCEQTSAGELSAPSCCSPACLHRAADLDACLPSGKTFCDKDRTEAE